MEAEIARRVAENVFLVGDEKQAIFGFQGGSTEYLKGFQRICKRAAALDQQAQHEPDPGLCKAVLP